MLEHVKLRIEACKESEEGVDQVRTIDQGCHQKARGYHRRSGEDDPTTDPVAKKTRSPRKTRPAHSRRPKWPLERPGAPPKRTYRLSEVVAAVWLPRGGGWVGWWWSGPCHDGHALTHTTRQATHRRSGASRSRRQRAPSSCHQDADRL